MSSGGFTCHHCKKKFSLEKIFLKHRCTQMERSEEIKTLIGQTAYVMYKHWLEKQGRKAPPIETFVTSNYYSSFIKFSEWIKDVNLPDGFKYIELMLNNKISPVLWRRNEAYQIYLEYTDKKANPYEQASISVETILSLAEGYEITPSEVFEKLKVGEVIELIQQRQLSPWLLFCSKRFKSWVNTLNSNEKDVLMNSIGINYWSLKLEKCPEVVKFLKQTAIELGI